MSNKHIPKLSNISNVKNNFGKLLGYLKVQLQSVLIFFFTLSIHVFVFAVLCIPALSGYASLNSLI